MEKGYFDFVLYYHENNSESGEEFKEFCHHVQNSRPLCRIITWRPFWELVSVGNKGGYLEFSRSKQKRIRCRLAFVYLTAEFCRDTWPQLCQKECFRDALCRRYLIPVLPGPCTIGSGFRMPPVLRGLQPLNHFNSWSAAYCSKLQRFLSEIVQMRDEEFNLYLRQSGESHVDGRIHCLPIENHPYSDDSEAIFICDYNGEALDLQTPRNRRRVVKEDRKDNEDKEAESLLDSDFRSLNLISLQCEDSLESSPENNENEAGDSGLAASISNDFSKEPLESRDFDSSVWFGHRPAASSNSLESPPENNENETGDSGLAASISNDFSKEPLESRDFDSSVWFGHRPAASSSDSGSGAYTSVKSNQDSGFSSVSENEFSKEPLDYLGKNDNFSSCFWFGHQRVKSQVSMQLESTKVVKQGTKSISVSIGQKKEKYHVCLAIMSNDSVQITLQIERLRPSVTCVNYNCMQSEDSALYSGNMARLHHLLVYCDNASGWKGMMDTNDHCSQFTVEDDETFAHSNPFFFVCTIGKELNMHEVLTFGSLLFVIDSQNVKQYFGLVLQSNDGEAFCCYLRPLFESFGINPEHKQDEQKINETLTVMENIILGKGKSATVVYRGKCAARDVAIKRINQSRNTGDVSKKVTREIDALMKLDKHENIVRYFAQATSTDNNFHYIALELCHGTLGQLIDTSEKIDEVHVLRQFFNGLNYIHKNRYVHRDIKLSNVLYIRDTTGLVIKISDLGLTKEITDDPCEDRGSGSVGTGGHMSPEMLDTTKRVTHKTDIFSSGILCCQVLTNGEHPFGKDKAELDYKIKYNRHELPCLFRNHMEVERYFIEQLIKHEPESRPDSQDVLNQPYFWDAWRKLRFFQDVSDELKNSTTREYSRAVEKDSKNIFMGMWSTKLSQPVEHELFSKHKYNQHTVEGLLRAIRNTSHHIREMSPQIASQEFGGTTPDHIINYFKRRFPTLLVHVYRAMQNHSASERLRDYYATFTP